MRKVANKNYIRLERSSDFSSRQFEAPNVNIPWKSIFLSLLLFVLGSILLTVGILLASGFIVSAYADRMWPLLVLGLITFIPGGYYVYVACQAYRGNSAYSFNDIPDYN